MGFCGYLAIADKKIVPFLVGIAGLILIVSSAILGKKTDDFLITKRFGKLKFQIDNDLLKIEKVV